MVRISFDDTLIRQNSSITIMFNTNMRVRYQWATLFSSITSINRCQHTSTAAKTTASKFIKPKTVTNILHNAKQGTAIKPTTHKPTHTTNQSIDSTHHNDKSVLHSTKHTHKKFAHRTTNDTAKVASTGTVQHTAYILPSHTTDTRTHYYISTAEQLNKLCTEVKDLTMICFDTEFISFPKYSPDLQLIQLSGPTFIAAVDPVLLGAAIKPLIELLVQKTLIVHSARFDLQMLYELTQRYNIEPKLPKSIFDTQIACSVLGISNMISLKDMLIELLAIDMNKSESLTDWSKRPLTMKQLEYALGDVRHLYQVYEILHQRLHDTNRIELFNVECSTLNSLKTFAPVDMDNLWRTVFHSKKLESQSIELTILQQLCIWREKLGQQYDWNPFTILKNETCYAIALQKPTTLLELSNVQNIKPTFVSRNGRDILRIVQEAESIPVDQRPVHAFDARDSDRLNTALMNLLLAYKHSKAAEIKINPFLLCSVPDCNEIASCSVEAITQVYKQKSHQPVDNTVATPVEPSAAPTITSTVFKQKPADLTVEQEIEVLNQLQVLNNWRLHSVGLDLLRIALGKAIQWNHVKSEVVWGDNFE